MLESTTTEQERYSKSKPGRINRVSSQVIIKTCMMMVQSGCRCHKESLLCGTFGSPTGLPYKKGDIASTPPVNLPAMVNGWHGHISPGLLPATSWGHHPGCMRAYRGKPILCSSSRQCPALGSEPVRSAKLCHRWACHQHRRVGRD